MAGDIEFRAATLADVPAIAALHAASWKDVYRSFLDPAFLAGPVDEQRLQVWQERIANPLASQHVILACRDGDLLGFVCAYRDREPIWGSYIDNLHVSPQARGTGLGTALLHETAAWALANCRSRSLYLWVFKVNYQARRFYESRRGREVEVIDDEAPDGSMTRSVRIHWPDARTLLQPPPD